MKVTVSAAHIEAAKCGNPYHCMIAEAIRDSCSGVRYVSVRTNGITLTQALKDGVSVRSHWAVPLKAARAIVKFDSGERVDPFSFEPKLVDKKILAPITEDKRKKNAAAQRAKRQNFQQSGWKEVWRQRIAGV